MPEYLCQDYHSGETIFQLAQSIWPGFQSVDTLHLLPGQHERSPGLPLLIIGILSLVGGALATLLPETAGVNLPQTLLDGDRLGRTACLPLCRRRTNAVADGGEAGGREKEAAS